MKTLEEKIEDVEDKHIEEKINNRIQLREQKERDKALMILGGIKVADKIAKSISSQVIVALLRIQKEKIFESLGYQRFADFLNNHPDSPMSKTAFYRQKELFEKEGEGVFDLLNDIDLPYKKRKLLGQGNIQLEGDTVYIKTEDSEKETEIELNDKTRLLETLTALADRSTVLKSQVDKKNKDIEKLTEKTEELKKENERIDAMKKRDLQDSHATALVNLAGAFAVLQSEAEKLTKAEKTQFAPDTFELIAEWRERLSETYERKPVSKSKKKKKADNTKTLASNLNDEELAELMS